MKDITICVDFDGTIVDHAFPEIGEAVPGALDWLTLFQEKGAKLILWTMRSDHQKYGNVLTQAMNYLRKNGIQIYAINMNPTQHTWTDSPKAYADIYIDDAAIGCPLIQVEGFNRLCVDWEKVGQSIISKFAQYSE